MAMHKAISYLGGFGTRCLQPHTVQNMDKDIVIAPNPSRIIVVSNLRQCGICST